MSDTARIKRITDKLAVLWAANPEQNLLHLLNVTAFDHDGSKWKPFAKLEDNLLEGAIDAMLLKSDISPDAFAYEADVTVEGVKAVKDRVAAVTRNSRSTRYSGVPSSHHSGSTFTPADEKAHAAACEGKNVADRCLYCGQDYMEHHNGFCPKE